MRRRIYVNGKPDWSDNEPARARVSGYGQGNTHDLTLVGGSFVQGDPGEVERARKSQAEYNRRHRA